MLPQELLYSEEGEWVRQENDSVLIGIALPIVEKLGEIIELELPEPGEKIQQTIELGSLEGENNFKEIFAPISGIVEAVNEEVFERPEIVFQDPYEDGWLLKVKVHDEDEFDSLLSSEEMEALLKKNGELEEGEDEFDGFQTE